MSCNKVKEGSTQESAEQSNCTAGPLVFEGTIPSADCDGIDMRLTLSGDSAKTYSMVSTYLPLEGVASQNSCEDGVADSYEDTGTYELVEIGGKQYYQLNCGNGSYNYMLILSDSVVRMVNRELEESTVEGMNYDLRLI